MIQDCMFPLQTWLHVPLCKWSNLCKGGSRIFQRGWLCKGGGGDYSLSDHQNMWAGSLLLTFKFSYVLAPNREWLVTRSTPWIRPYLIALPTHDCLIWNASSIHMHDCVYLPKHGLKFSLLKTNTCFIISSPLMIASFPSYIIVIFLFMITYGWTSPLQAWLNVSSLHMILQIFLQIRGCLFQSSPLTYGTLGWMFLHRKWLNVFSSYMIAFSLSTTNWMCTLHTWMCFFTTANWMFSPHTWLHVPSPQLIECVRSTHECVASPQLIECFLPTFTWLYVSSSQLLECSLSPHDSMFSTFSPSTWLYFPSP